MKNIKEIAQNIAKVVEQILSNELEEFDALDEINPNEDLLEETDGSEFATIDDMSDFTPLDLSDKLK